MSILPFSPPIQHDRPGADAELPIVALHQRVQDFDLSERARERDEELAFQTVLNVDAVLTGSFRDTLDPVVQAMAWTGYPPLEDNELMASAITHLGTVDGVRGWWLHYTRHPETVEHDDLVHVLTLIAPCVCGSYTEVELVDEDALIVLLDELDTPPGAPIACDPQLRIRRTSYADTRHANLEPPW
ncbi:hypothetical protein ABR738_01315 [Streptomyces sp. Edi4]|uniref:hypothetical protein n=1 Tax=Streptomyces sp. Edi4 TaxID=3162527 RepID=UPI0033057087